MKCLRQVFPSLTSSHLSGNYARYKYKKRDFGFTTVPYQSNNEGDIVVFLNKKILDQMFKGNWCELDMLLQSISSQ